MIPSAFRPYPPWQLNVLACLYILLLAALTRVPSSHAQPAEIDERSTLILHFDPMERAASADRGDPYLTQVADGLEADWFAETGAGAIAVGPVFARSGETFEFGHIDPSLGTAKDWNRLLSVARKEDVAVAVRLTDHTSFEDASKLADWAADMGVRHFILEGAAIADVAALRSALNSGTNETSWIAASSEKTAAAAVEADLFDALIETLSADDFSSDASFGKTYEAFFRRSSTSPRPLIASVPIPGRAAGLLAARVLMLPGAVQVTMSAHQDESTELWRRIAEFRARHPAVSRGEHLALVNSAFTFARISSESGTDDRVIVVLGASGKTTLNVSRVFPDNALLQDALTGRTAFVSFGMASFEPDASGVILIEEAP